MYNIAILYLFHLNVIIIVLFIIIIVIDGYKYFCLFFISYMKIRGANQTGDVPTNYRCYKCHQPGHWIKNCPLGTNQEPIEIKKSTGIPRSFMVPVEGPLVPGAMMTPTGQYAVPAIDQ